MLFCLDRDTAGTRPKLLGLSRPFRDGWQLCMLKDVTLHETRTLIRAYLVMSRKQDSYIATASDSSCSRYRDLECATHARKTLDSVCQLHRINGTLERVDVSIQMELFSSGGVWSLQIRLLALETCGHCISNC